MQIESMFSDLVSHFIEEEMQRWNHERAPSGRR